MITTREYAEQIVAECYCDGCGSIDCTMHSICDGFQKEIDDLLKAWKDEDKEKNEKEKKKV